SSPCSVPVATICYQTAVRGNQDSHLESPRHPAMCGQWFRRSWSWLRGRGGSRFASVFRTGTDDTVTANLQTKPPCFTEQRRIRSLMKKACQEVREGRYHQAEPLLL